MDLKSKGISWAGNFYQKFEKVCHEVDNIVNQEAVKYVENQVQSVGKNMKKFYSDVITDMLHPLMDPVKHDVQEKSLEKNAAIHSHIESEMGIDKNHVDKENEESHFEPSEFDPLEAANFDQAPTQVADAFTDRNSKLKFQESTALEKSCLDEGSELTSPGKEEFFGDSFQYDSKCVSDSSSAMKSTEMMSSVIASEKNMVDAVDLSSRSPLRETILLENSNENASARALSSHSHVDVDGFISHTELPSSPSTTTFTSENKVSEMGLISSSTILSSESIDSSSALRSTEMTGSDVSSEENIVDAADFSSRFPLRESILLENSNNNSPGRAVSCHSSVDVAGFVSHDVLQSSLSTTLSSENKEMGLISSSIDMSSELIDSLSTLRSTEMMSSVVSFEENAVDAADISTMSSLRGSFLLDNSNENSPAREASCHSMVDVAGFISQTVLPFPSSLSSVTLSGENMVSETGLISSSSALSSELMEPSDDSNDADNVSSMETIDLCDHAKLDDSCVYVDNSALYAVSHTLRKHRSYKQMLQDALTANKRLVKEYEQLAIWFGDADIGSDKESMQSLLPSTAATTMGCRNSQTELEGDSGWELL